MSAAPIRFCDVARINAPYAEEIEAAVARVIAGGSLILGDEVRAFERDVEHFLGVRHAIGVGTGTDALTLSLIACGVGVGDEVLVPSFTYFAAVEAIRWSEATPRLLDVNELGDVRMEDIDGGAKTKACILPSLYGRATPIDEGIRRHSSNKIAIIEDACQAFGAMTAGGRFAGTRGVAGCFSFYPTKVLGAAGDGGMVVTDSDSIAEAVRSLRTHGAEPTNKYRHVRMGMNSRLDAIQAAILRIKLAHLPEAIRRRREIAARYDAHFSKHATWMTRPALGKGDTFYAYVVKCINGSRDALRLHLADAGIEAPIHFPIPVHAQPAFVEMFGAAENLERFAVSTKLASSVLSLPCHPALHDDEIDFIGESVDAFARKHGPL